MSMTAPVSEQVQKQRLLRVVDGLLDGVFINYNNVLLAGSIVLFRFVIEAYDEANHQN
jgi:hypothetical protein